MIALGDLLCAFEVSGRPRPKGSLKGYCQKNAAHTVRFVEQVEQGPVWRRKMALAAQADMKARHGRLLGEVGPVAVRALFVYERPEEEGDWCWPIAITYGDTDKLIRNLGDALTDSRLIMDDSQIVGWPDSWKVYGEQAYVRVQVYRAPEPGRLIDEW